MRVTGANAAFTRLAHPSIVRGLDITMTASRRGAVEPFSEIGYGTDALCEALLESRQRWRDLVTMTADFVFETDAQGRLVFVAPALALGWPAETLLGLPAADLLADPHGFDPFRLAGAVRGQRCWLKRADGGFACLSFACAPLADSEDGRWAGCRGMAQDVTAQNAREAASAAALRRGEVIEHILWQMRQEVLAPRMMQAALEEVMGAIGAQGAAVVDLLVPQDDLAAVMHSAGSDVRPPAGGDLRHAGCGDAGPRDGGVGGWASRPRLPELHAVRRSGGACVVARAGRVRVEP